MHAQNLFAALASDLDAEVFETLAEANDVKIERIVTQGPETPDGEWYDQDRREWVCLLRGAAEIRFADPDESVKLGPGDWLDIAPHRCHRVQWSDPNETTVWLAVHF